MLVLATCLAAMTFLAPATAAAQFAEAAPAPEVSSAEIEVLVQSLQDPEARAKLIAQLKALRAAQETAEGVQEEPGLGAMLLATLSENVRQASDGLVAVATALLNAPMIVAWAAEQARDPAVRNLWFELIWKIALILAAAMTIEWLVNRLLARPRQRLENRPAENSYLWRLPYALLHLLLELLPIAAFMAIAYGVMSALAPSEITRLVVLAIINANLATRLVAAAVRTALAPRARSLRLINVSDETANYLLIWMRRVSGIAVYGYFIAEAGLLLGLPPALHIFMLRAVGLVVAGMLVIFVLQNRSGVAQWLKGRGEGGTWNRLRNRFADIWHFLALLYVFAVYCVWALNIAGGFAFLFRATLLTFLLLFVVRMITAGISRMVERGFALSSELKARFPRLESRANRYLPLLQRILFAVIYVVTALSLLEVWGIDAYGWLSTDFGQRLTRSLITIGFIFLGALLATEVVNGIVESFLNKRQRNADDPGRGARLRTLLPLVRNAFRIVLVVMVTLIVLSELGINIAPLLAGAGVVGLAVGFGAQTLVKDVITGIFILAEDTIAVGDVADIDSRIGMVEAMTIRSIRLRDGAGAVHTIPFSAVTTVKNMTKDYANAVFDIGVGYDADLEKVNMALRQIGEDLRKDPKFARDILEPMAVVGITKFQENGMIIQAHIKTRPMRQWDVRNEVHLRLRKAFAEQGIEFAVPQRHITHRWENAPPAETLARKSISGLG
ncbi:MAG: mechanosensitive ion channel domain-containing protein [Dongiaceae bacterium]